MTWHEQKKPIVTNKGVQNKAPIHRQVKLSQSTLSQPIPPPLPREIQEYLNNPTTFLTKFSQLYSLIKSQPKWQSRDDYIKLIIKQTADKSIKDRDVRNFLDYIKEAEEDSKLKSDSTYEATISNLNNAKTLKEVGEINQSATKAEMQDKITFDQLQKIYSLVNEKDDYLSRANESAVDIYQMRINNATTKEEIGEIAREIEKSSLSSGYKAQLDKIIKKKFGDIIESLWKEHSDPTLVNEFKSKIQNATQINELNELNFQVTDNVAKGNFTKAKVIPSDIQNLHELINDKIFRLFKEKIGTTEECQKTPITIFSISNEINRLRELNQKIQA